jgi:hypothetical protein
MFGLSLLAQFGDNSCSAPDSSSITANYVEEGFQDIGEDQGWYMTDFDRVGERSGRYF